MVDFAAIELGKLLGNNIKKTDEYKQDFVESENNADIGISAFSSMSLSGSYIITKYNFGTTSFILDHPIYGELDSSILELDGGYGVAETITSTFPLSFPILFTTTALGSEIIGSGLF